MARTDWHRLFGLALKDLFLGKCYEVELEKDLSEQRQFLDIVVVRRDDTGLPEPDPAELPDGLDRLRAHNLISFKSLHEPFDSFALVELVGHMVAYAKLIGAEDWREFCQQELGLFAICTRKPGTEFLAEALRPTGLSDVFEILVCGFAVRCVVLGEAPANERNALWNLFSARDERVRFGAQHYQWKSPETSTIMRRLSTQYHLEGFPMPYTLEDYLEEVIPEILEDLTPEKRREVMQRIPVDERLEGLSAKDRMIGLSPDEIRQALAEIEKN